MGRASIVRNIWINEILMVHIHIYIRIRSIILYLWAKDSGPMYVCMFVSVSVSVCISGRSMYDKANAFQLNSNL